MGRKPATAALAVIKRMRARFHTLVVLEALGKASPGDRQKLDRYQALLREKPSREIVSLWARQEWEYRCLMKTARRAIHAYGRTRRLSEITALQ